jgi:putative phage repressor
MKAIDRIKQYIDYKGFTNRSFEQKNNLSNGYIATQLKRNADLGEGILNKVLENCLEINPKWLLTGKGEMLNHPYNEATHNINSSNNTYINSVGDNFQEKTNEKNIYNEMIITQRELIDSLKKQIIQYRKEIEYLRQIIKECNENNGK